MTCIRLASDENFCGSEGAACVAALEKLLPADF